MPLPRKRTSWSRYTRQSCVNSVPGDTMLERPSLVDWLNRAVNAGCKIFWYSLLSTQLGMRSGPAVLLWGFSCLSNLRTSAVWICSDSIFGVDNPNHGMINLSLRVKADSNSSSNIVSSSAAPEKTFPWCASVGIPMLSCPRYLMRGLMCLFLSPLMTLLFTYPARVFLQSSEICFQYSLNGSIFSGSLLALTFL